MGRRGAIRSMAAGVMIALGVALSLGLTACTPGATGSGSGSGLSGKATYRVGVLQLTEHGALDQANKGFVKALKESKISCEIDQQNAQGDQSACQTIAAKLVNDGDDLIYAIGTQAAQSVASTTTDIPIVGSAITDFAAAGLVSSNGHPDTNVTGTSDLTPVSDQIGLLHELLPAAKTVGLLYCSAESNSETQIKLAEAACGKLGLGTKRFTVSSSNEIQQVVESMAGKVDVIYTPTDNTIAAGMDTVSMVAGEQHLPTIVGCDTMVEQGGLASYSINYEKLGHRAGLMAAKILKGEAKPQDMAIEHLSDDECRLIVNRQTAEELGVDLSVLDGKDVLLVGDEQH